MSEFFAMGGYAFYVWISYGVFLVILLMDAAAPVLRRRRVIEGLRGRFKRADSRGSQT